MCWMLMFSRVNNGRMVLSEQWLSTVMQLPVSTLLRQLKVLSEHQLVQQISSPIFLKIKLSEFSGKSPAHMDTGCTTTTTSATTTPAAAAKTTTITTTTTTTTTKPKQHQQQQQHQQQLQQQQHKREKNRQITESRNKQFELLMKKNFELICSNFCCESYFLVWTFNCLLK